MKYILSLFSIIGIILIFVLTNVFDGTKNIQFLRIHIRANSNEEIDQNVKYKVRDDVVEYLIPLLSNIQTFDDAKKLVEENFDEIEKVANKRLLENGMDYSSHAEIKNEYFPTRTYENITLKEGYYDALILNLGTGKGDNWWCIVFPAFCFTKTTQKNNIVYISRIWDIIKSVI